MTLFLQLLIAVACASIASAAISSASIKNDGLAIIAIAKAMPMLLTVSGESSTQQNEIRRHRIAS